MSEAAATPPPPQATTGTAFLPASEIAFLSPLACLASGDSDDGTDEFTLDAAAVVAEEAVSGTQGGAACKTAAAEWAGRAGVAGPAPEGAGGRPEERDTKREK
jgi:hypothetical protein